jgi:pimeloyl-ACP methyl ester carboxylesterase
MSCAMFLMLGQFSITKWKLRPGRNKSVDKPLVEEPESVTTPSPPLSSPGPVTAASIAVANGRSHRRESEPRTVDAGPRSPPFVPTRAHTTIPERSCRISTEEIRKDPTGLVLLYEPEISPQFDIIFVHGTGGSSLISWSKDEILDKCWPKRWLPAEPRVRMARIFSFGYNSVFGRAGPTPLTEIPDHARRLLTSMKARPTGQFDDLLLGHRPIIFVAHSTGGLVVKQAYLLAQTEEECRDIVTSISCIMFLAVPNRGSDMTAILDRVLAVSLDSAQVESLRSSGELANGSEFITSINEQFRTFAPRLEILSYYEQLETAAGEGSLVSVLVPLFKISKLILQMVLEPESSKLGTHGELAVPLDANHSTMCKFDNSQDSNYVHLRNGLDLLMKRVRSKGKIALWSPKTQS